ncbi:aspartic proteinase CDR1-like [Senna tora]|uniref:Aspartic proteinase CDR1-like n=1 Tax=Senna tora TaxID=362788 RepID=A0A835CET6_9FABA|nr:aspartic proteinase CDR1-like [Senna tora]
MASSALPIKLSLLFLFLFTTTFAFPPPSTTAKPRRIVTKLHHKPSTTHHHHSLARLAYLVAKARATDDDTQSPVLPESSGTQFMANFSVGIPPVPQLLTIDTGSNLLWIQCLPCTKCFNQTSPLFDPSKSSTYTNIPCTYPSCNISSHYKCDASYNCKFTITYLDHTKASGLLATDYLTFDTSDEGPTTVPSALLGCAHDNDGYNGEPSGILGLGPSKNSLVTQLGSKFSYCLGSIMDPKYPHSVLILGEGADVDGDQTPLEVFNGLYYLGLEGVSVGEKRLEIDPNVFKRTQEGKGGVVIDSGTTVSFMVGGGYGVVIDEVRRMMEGKAKEVRDPTNPSSCYEGVIEREASGFPVVRFHFEGGAELGLDVNSFFHENGKDEFCVALEESEELSVIGVMAQQSYNVGFDVKAAKCRMNKERDKLWATLRLDRLSNVLNSSIICKDGKLVRRLVMAVVVPMMEKQHVEKAKIRRCNAIDIDNGNHPCCNIILICQGNIVLENLNNSNVQSEQEYSARKQLYVAEQKPNFHDSVTNRKTRQIDSVHYKIQIIISSNAT